MAVRVLITDLNLGDPEFEAGLLRAELGAEVTIRQCQTESDVLAAVTETSPHAILVQYAPVTAAVLAAAGECRIVSRFGIGVDMIDEAAARDRGIEVRNVSDYCLEEVATHAVAMGLSLWRQLPELDREVRAGGWDAAAAAPGIRRLSDSTVGLIGLGRIGRRVADAFAVWGSRILVHDPVQGDDPYPRVPLAQLAAESDLISLHVPLTAETRHIVDADLLAATRCRPIVVNVSRGGLVDTVALAAALEAGTIAGAGLDVFESEPLDPADPIRTAPRTLLTPHAAWCSDTALPALRAGAVWNVVDALRPLIS
jgi:D-3-phosphoglycerate dehydrogenase